jgi:hypothetical protein
VRITLVNQFYAPDISPTAQLAASLAEHRAEQGDVVTVITGRSGYLEGISPTGMVATRDTQRRPGASAQRGYLELEELADRYLSVWSGAEDSAAIAHSLHRDAELQDGVANVTLSGRQGIGRAASFGTGISGTRPVRWRPT